MPDADEARIIRPLDARRLLKIAGIVVWLMVGVPLVLEPALDPLRVVFWLPAYLGFLIAFLMSTSRVKSGWLLPLEAFFCLALVLLLCDGFEGSLLVLVALQAGARWSRKHAVLWVVGTSVLLGVAIGIHWTPRPAILLAPPYFGFQLLAVLLASANRELEAARDLAEQNARLEERLRISRELHDAVGHHLTALSLNLEAIARQVEGRALEPVETARALTKLLLRDVRAVVASLREREGERTDLFEAMQAIAAEIPHPKIHLTLPASVRIDDPESVLTVLRCTQEIVTNAARHAQASNVWIELSEDSRAFELRAHDDGCGAPELVAGNGLVIMRERLEARGGHLTIESRPGVGFSVRAAIPRAGR